MWRRLVVFSAMVMGASGLLGDRASSQTAGRAAWIDGYRESAARIVRAADADDFAWRRLAELTDTFGPRLSGSTNLQSAIDWTVRELERDGFDAVSKEPAMVPRWIRGAERLDVVEPGPRPLPVLGLGGTVATPPGGIQAEVLVVDGFDMLDRRARDARGRIVVFDVPFTTYGETVRYRFSGPSRAARVGAVAVLLRSVGPVGLRTPHTGALAYSEGAPRIPAAAISAEDSAMLARMQARGTRVRLRLALEATHAADVPSANVVAELRGRERPGDIVVLGCHLDSWDVGTGASDDAAGCVMVWEAIRLLKVTGLRPRRTMRLVLFTNEENGLRGGGAYLDRHRQSLRDHVLMFEADMGTFAPFSVGFSGSPVSRARIEDLVPLVRELGIDRIAGAGGGADIGPAAEAGGVPTMSLAGDPARYFAIHHTAADTVERIDPKELSRAAAIVSILTYVVADMPQRLGEPGVESSR